MADFISNEQYKTATLYFTIPTNVIFTMFGISSNTANIITFSKMTPKDTVTISLTALAVSDLAFNAINLFYFIFNTYLVLGYPVMWNIDLRSLLLITMAWQRPLFHKISSAITTLVSCERSFCVVKPFLVKQIFTKRRCIYAIIGIYIVLTAIFVPVYANGWLAWSYVDNNTQPILKAFYTPQRFTAESVVIIVAAFGLVWVSQILILVTAVMMAVGLRRHQKFRKTLVSGKEGTDTGKEDVAQEEKDGGGTSQAQKLAASHIKEDRLIKTVLILAVMHITLNLPLSFYYVAHQAYPEFRPFARYHNLNILVTDVVNILQSLNGVFNIFVYLTMNAKFKAIFKQTFCTC